MTLELFGGASVGRWRARPSFPVGGAEQPTRPDGRFVGRAAASDFSIDLRSHELRRLWDLGHVGGNASRVSAVTRIAKKGLGGPSAARGHKNRPLAIAHIRSDAIMAISQRAPTKPRENPLPGGGGGPRRPQADHTSIRFGLRAMSPLGRRGEKDPGGGWSRSRRLGRPNIYQGGDQVNLLGDCTKGLHA